MRAHHVTAIILYILLSYQDGCLLSTFSSFDEQQSSINSIVPVHSMPNLILVATNYSLCLLHCDKLEVVWKVMIKNGLLR